MVYDLDIVLNSELNNTKNRYDKWMIEYRLFKNSSELVQNFIPVPPNKLPIYSNDIHIFVYNKTRRNRVICLELFSL